MGLFVGVDGIEPPTLPTYKSGCSELMSFSMSFLLFQFFTWRSLSKACCLVSNDSVWTIFQSAAHQCNQHNTC